MIALQGVSQSFDGGATDVVRGMMPEVPSGPFLAVIGAAGSGKATLLKTLDRRLEPEAGEGLIGGEPVCAPAAHHLRRRIGWMEEAVRARIEELIALVSRPSAYLTRQPAELSGREHPRVGIALARGPAEHPADGRALRRARSAEARGARQRVLAAARERAPHHRQRDARHSRSGAARQPDRGDASPADRRRRRAARTAFRS